MHSRSLHHFITCRNFICNWSYALQFCTYLKGIRSLEIITTPWSSPFRFIPLVPVNSKCVGSIDKCKICKNTDFLQLPLILKRLGPSRLWLTVLLPSSFLDCVFTFFRLSFHFRGKKKIIFVQFFYFRWYLYVKTEAQICDSEHPSPFSCVLIIPGQEKRKQPLPSRSLQRFQVIINGKIQNQAKKLSNNFYTKKHIT